MVNIKNNYYVAYSYHAVDVQKAFYSINENDGVQDNYKKGHKRLLPRQLHFSPLKLPFIFRVKCIKIF